MENLRFRLLQKKNYPHLVCRASENFNKQLRNCFVEMIFDDRTLEAIVQEEDEIQVAIESLQEAPVIEKQLDTESYESTSYSIEMDYNGASYETGKNYYELIMGENDEYIGASMTAVYSEHYHELLQDVQEIAASMRHGNETNCPFIEAQIDFNVREKKNSIKLVSVALWQAMYDGKLIFN